MYDMRLLKAFEDKLLPHYLATLLWFLLVIVASLNPNLPLIVPGTVAWGGLKMVMLFSVLLLVIPVVLCVALQRIRPKGIAERYVIVISVATAIFAFINVSLHFVDEYILLMKTTEVIAWGLYNTIIPVSVYKVSIAFLERSSTLRRFLRANKETVTEQTKSLT